MVSAIVRQLLSDPSTYWPLLIFSAFGVTATITQWIVYRRKTAESREILKKLGFRNGWW